MKMDSKRVATINLVSIYLCSDHVNISQTKEFFLPSYRKHAEIPETKVSAW